MKDEKAYFHCIEFKKLLFFNKVEVVLSDRLLRFPDWGVRSTTFRLSRSVSSSSTRRMEKRFPIGYTLSEDLFFRSADGKRMAIYRPTLYSNAKKLHGFSVLFAHFVHSLLIFLAFPYSIAYKDINVWIFEYLYYMYIRNE